MYNSSTSNASGTYRPAYSLPSGRVSLDTTSNYSGLKMNRTSTANDIAAMQIKNNKDNLISNCDGSEIPIKLAVMLFNSYKNEDPNALVSLSHPITNNNAANHDLSGKSDSYVAYKVIEYSPIKQSLVDSFNKIYKKGTEYYEALQASEGVTVTMLVYTYNKDPYYLNATFYNIRNNWYLNGYYTRT